jgi:hypothetical protein
VGLFLSGCATSKVTYNGEINKYRKNIQIVENKECVYLIGPFNITDKITVEEAIKRTVAKAQKDGFNGNKLVNIEVHEDIATGIVASKQCIVIKGNLIYEEGYVAQ